MSFPPPNDPFLNVAKPGIWLPAGWGQFWKPARNSARNSLARIGIMGDSGAWGAYSSNPYTKGWAGQVIAALQKIYGDGGSGFVGVQSTPQGLLATGVSAAGQTAYNALPQSPTATGTWAFKGNVGPGGTAMFSTTAGDSITFTVRGSNVTLYYEAQASGFATFTWTIDGVAQAPINGTATNGSYSTTVSGLSSGNHTVTLTVPAGGAFVSIYGCAGTNNTGVVLHNFSKFGASSTIFVGTTYVDVASWSGGPSNPVDLLIYEVGTADANAGTAADTWAQNAGKSLRAVCNVANPATDLLMVRHPIGNADNATPQWPTYASRAYDLAQFYGAAVIDYNRLANNSYNYWSNLGYWSDTTGSGAAGGDAVHPSDAGHAYMANQLTPILTA